MNDLEREKDSMKRKWIELRMRHNLIIGNLEETVNETPAQTVKIVRDFLMKSFPWKQLILYDL
jgi:hypothetical protein